MKKNLFLLLISTIIIPSKLISQELLYEKEVKLKSSFFSKRKKESFPVVNNKKNEIGMFLFDRKEIKGFIFDQNYVLKDSFTTAKPKGSFYILLGHTYNDNNYSLIFSNENKTKFLKKTINITDKKSDSEEFNIKIKKGNFLESLSYDNKLYVLTIKKGTSIITIYEFKEGNISRTEKIDLSKQKFSKVSKSLSYVLSRTTSAVRENIILNKIDNRNPNSIDLVSYANKIYSYNNTIYITLDIYDDYTKVISINLSNFETKVEDFPFTKVDCDYDLGIKSNSYLLEDRIYQVNGCKKELHFMVSNISSKTKIKEWRVKKEEVIDFKNTPLIQLGGAFNRNKKYKELSETQQILKKIENGNIGIAAYKKQDNIEVTIGGYKKMHTKELIAAGLAGVAMSSGAHPVSNENTNYHYNTTMYSFQNYSHARSVYFKSIFNENLENIKGSLTDNAFDKIRKYLDNSTKKLSITTIFKVKDYYVLGFYESKEKKYYLLKFVD